MRRYRSFICDSARWDGFELRAGDIVVTTPPKCGTTWMQMCCLLLVHGAPLPAPLGELSVWVDQELKAPAEVRALYDAQQHRRVLKTHTPLDGMPWRDDITYVGVGRDPRDVALSMRDHMQNMDMDAARRARTAAGVTDDAPGPGSGPPPAGANEFDTWVEDTIPLETFKSTLALTLHHLGLLWARRDEPNVLLFHYADMRADLPRELRRLADGLGIDIDGEHLVELADAASIDAMRGDADRLAPNTSISLWRDNRRFFAEGRVGAWREVLDDGALARYEKRVAQLAPDPELLAWLHR